MKLFEYAVILHPKKDKDGNQTDKDSILIAPKLVLASDQAAATMFAARAIPETHIDRLEELEVAIRPF